MKQILKVKIMDFVTKVTVTEKEATHYNADQLDLLYVNLEDAPLKFKTIIDLALASQTRLGELVGLTWDCVDFENRKIHINKVAQYLPKMDKKKMLTQYPDTPPDLLERNIIIKPPKTKKSKRYIKIRRSTMEILEEYKNFQEQWTDSNWIFTDENGSIMHPLSPSQWFHGFLIEKELDPMPYHGLRHTGASILVANGNDVVAVSRRLGHSTSATTHKIYFHTSDVEDEKAADSLDRKKYPDKLSLAN